MNLVSVIIPTHNDGTTIHLAINSILLQKTDGFDIEIIIIDDGSDNKNAAIIDSFMGIATIMHIKNCGPDVSRNKGIKKSKGNFIAFLDADDFWYPTKLYQQLTLMQSHSNIGLVYSDGIKYMNVSEKILLVNTFFKSMRPYRGDVSEPLIDNNFIATSSTVVRRECFDTLGVFLEERVGSLDWEMWLRISTNYLIDYIDGPLIGYRKSSTSFSGDPLIHLRGAHHVFETAKRLSPELESNSIIADQRNSFNQAIVYADLGQWNKAKVIGNKSGRSGIYLSITLILKVVLARLRRFGVVIYYTIQILIFTTVQRSKRRKFYEVYRSLFAKSYDIP